MSHQWVQTPLRLIEKDKPLRLTNNHQLKLPIPTTVPHDLSFSSSSASISSLTISVTVHLQIQLCSEDTPQPSALFFAHDYSAGFNWSFHLCLLLPPLLKTMGYHLVV